MAHRLTRRFTSFLDRFESRLEVDCERLKQQLAARVDHQFGVLRSKVRELRGRFGGVDRDSVPSFHLDDPKVKTVSLDEWILELNATTESRNAPSTSTGRKRKVATVSRSRSSNKRQKTVTTGTKKFACKYRGCGKSFPWDHQLAKHEHIHLGIKPYSCSWPNCRFSSVERGNVVRHVREHHFKLPFKKKGQPLVTDERDPNRYVKVDNDLLKRRLE